MRDVGDEAIGDTWWREGDGRRAWLVVLEAGEAELVERAADACGESVMAFARRATLRLAAQVPPRSSGGGSEGM